jgi:hypothetical protein
MCVYVYATGGYGKSPRRLPTVTVTVTKYLCPATSSGRLREVATETARLPATGGYGKSPQFGARHWPSTQRLPMINGHGHGHGH